MKINKVCRQICLGSLLFASFLAMGAKVVKTENPLVDKSNTSKLFVDAVELAPDSTTVTFHTYCYMGNNIRILPSVKLVHDGKNYPLRSANGIELGKWINIPALGDTIFTLSFEPLPIKTKSFDFIEGDGDSDFRLEGIHIDRSVDSQTPIEKLKELPTQKWENGTAVLKGKILNYQTDGEQTSVQVYPRSALGRLIDKNIGVALVNSDGSFEVKLPLFQSYQPCFFTAPGFYGLIYLSPDKESEVTIDQTQRWSRGHHGKDGSVVFTGANEELNNQLALNIGHDMVWDSFFNNVSRDKTYISASEYKADVLRHKANGKEKIKKLPFTPMMKHQMDVDIDINTLRALIDRYSLRNCKDMDSTYYNFLREVDIEDSAMMWSSEFDTFINSLYNPFVNKLGLTVTNIPSDFYYYLIDNKIAIGKDEDLARKLIYNNNNRVPKEIVDEYAKTAESRVLHYSDSLNLDGSERADAEKLMNTLHNGELKKYHDVTSYYLSWLLNLLKAGHKFSFTDAAEIPFDNDMITGIERFFEDNDSIITDFKERYADYQADWEFEKDIDTAIDNFSNLYGKESTLMNQLLAMQAYMDFIERRNTLSELKIANSRKRLPDLFFEYLMTQNDEMTKVLARAKSNILEMNPQNSGDEVLKEIAKKHKGKVIYIDIWGTWCSPCLSAITELEPEKKNYSDNVTFVYLADETSPENIWEEKTKSIEGDHIRLSQIQMQEIMSRFAFSGYPSYIVIGKDGTITYSGFLHGLENIKKLLDDEIAK